MYLDDNAYIPPRWDPPRKTADPRHTNAATLLLILVSVVAFAAPIGGATLFAALHAILNR